jgi:hypothetical protein
MIRSADRIYINSAPICDPCRHLTRARRPEPASRDIKKVNIPGTVPAAPTVICTPVSDRSTTLHGRTANPSPKRIHAFAPAFLREALRCSFRSNLNCCVRPKNDMSYSIDEHPRIGPAQWARAHCVESVFPLRSGLNLQIGGHDCGDAEIAHRGVMRVNATTKTVPCDQSTVRCPTV